MEKMMDNIEQTWTVNDETFNSEMDALIFIINKKFEDDSGASVIDFIQTNQGLVERFLTLKTNYTQIRNQSYDIENTRPGSFIHQRRITGNRHHHTNSSSGMGSVMAGLGLGLLLSDDATENPIINNDSSSSFDSSSDSGSDFGGGFDE